eukprot:CAMPEP_0178565462 /NCGR_PEP_ID=MMETSP0697-20121206/14179_1 /TAXON_ID=265572 /ORGANISM="Extubocellulus spinifer, Strain CCMP396" /LENGTH=31 /DNA_ID= /DNA_START= /DNA_END= /DNA_ORIENTATION=
MTVSCSGILLDAVVQVSRSTVYMPNQHESSK